MPLTDAPAYCGGPLLATANPTVFSDLAIDGKSFNYVPLRAVCNAELQTVKDICSQSIREKGFGSIIYHVHSYSRSSGAKGVTAHTIMTLGTRKLRMRPSWSIQVLASCHGKGRGKHKWFPGFQLPIVYVVFGKGQDGMDIIEIVKYTLVPEKIRPAKVDNSKGFVLGASYPLDHSCGLEECIHTHAHNPLQALCSHHSPVGWGFHTPFSYLAGLQWHLWLWQKALTPTSKTKVRWIWFYTQKLVCKIHSCSVRNDIQG